MGRRKGSLNKSTLAKMGLLQPGQLPPGTALIMPDSEYDHPDNRTDEQIVEDIEERFDIYQQMMEAATRGEITSLIVSGSAGVGKSYTAEKVVSDKKQKDVMHRSEVVKGAISAIGLYSLGYNYQNTTDVLVLDDADRIFDEEDGLNLLKCMLDTSIDRKVSWHTDHSMFRGEDALPHDFIYRGSMVFLTNKDFQRYIDLNAGRYVEHMEALMSRSIYLDLKIHTRRETCLWVKSVVMKNHVLVQLGLTRDQEIEAIDWLVKNLNQLREISIRTALKLGKMMLMDSKGWTRPARVALLKQG